jgi:hypothetical protein
MNNEEQIIAAIRALDGRQTEQLNRLLACESLMHSLIQILTLPALLEIARHFDDSLSQAMSQLAPLSQRPRVWSDLEATLQDAIERQRRAMRGPA